MKDFFNPYFLVVYCCLLILVSAVSVGVSYLLFTPSVPTTNTRPSDYQFEMTSRHNSHDLFGTSNTQGVSIVWAGTRNGGATTLAVIEVTLDRMEFEQSTDFASDANARAMSHLILARSALCGGAETTTDGDPILE